MDSSIFINFCKEKNRSIPFKNRSLWFRTACPLISSTHRLCCVTCTYWRLLHATPVTLLDWLERIKNNFPRLVSLTVRPLSRFAERPDERRRMREPRRIRNCTWRRPPSRGSYRSWTWECSWTYRPAWTTTNGWRRTPSHCSTILISYTARYPSSAPWRAVPTWPVPA